MRSRAAVITVFIIIVAASAAAVMKVSSAADDIAASIEGAKKKAAAMSQQMDLQTAIPALAEKRRQEGLGMLGDLPATLESPDFQTRIEEQRRQILKDAGKVSGSATGQAALSSGRIYYLFSSSVPEAEVRNVLLQMSYLRQPEAVAVLRGLKGDSFKETLAYLNRLLTNGEDKLPVEVWIDPRLFAWFQIKAVPAFVYVPATGLVGDGEIAGSATAWAVRGDVTLEDALEVFSREVKGFRFERRSQS